MLEKLKISTRLVAGFAITLLLLCLVGGLAVLEASHIYAGTVDLTDKWLPSVEVLGDIRASANQVRRTTLESVLKADPHILLAAQGEKQALRAEHDAAVAGFNSTFGEYETLIRSPQDRQHYETVKKAWDEYMALDKQLLELADGGEVEFASARALTTGDSAFAFDVVTKQIAEHVQFNRQGAQDARAAVASSYRSALMLTTILTAIAGVLSTGIAVIITRSITVPIGKSVTIAETVARGDLTSKIEVSGKDELSQLLLALKHMNERLVDVVGRVRMSSESIATGTSQIAAGNTDLSQRTEQQAASLEETAASMEELTATVKQNAENARQGNALASNASEIAERGGQVVRRVVEMMSEISSSSERVAQITGVIDGIAFQTNILALNAAVEAARAGEQGRGFAVVASEVRSLAQRSASAAKEIKALIGQSVDQVNTGSRLVNEAGGTIDEVVRSVKRMTDLMSEITAASEEQHTGIEQVNQAVTQMDEVTQQNAALVEEASAAAQSMAGQSNTLRELVSIFKLNSAATESAAAAPPRRPVQCRSL